MKRTLIIAEIGECFNGDLNTAKTLIFKAKDAGCDIAKFQTLDYESISKDDPEAEWFKKIALNPEKIARLIGFAKEAGIGILFSPENIKTAKWILDAEVKQVKIASSKIIDKRFIGFINDNFNRAFVSTGMASLQEVRTAVKELNKIKDLYILHCVSEYPTGPLLERRGLRALAHNDVRLNMMCLLVQMFPQAKIGYSDHTSGILALVVAVAMGAKVIEKHITLDRKTPVRNFLNKKGEYLGTDHIFSLEPHELKEMVVQIREVENILGEQKWERSEGEKILKDFLRGRFQRE